MQQSSTGVEEEELTTIASEVNSLMDKIIGKNGLIYQLKNERFCEVFYYEVQEPVILGDLYCGMLVANYEVFRKRLSEMDRAKIDRDIKDKEVKLPNRRELVYICGDVIQHLRVSEEGTIFLADIHTYVHTKYLDVFIKLVTEYVHRKCFFEKSNAQSIRGIIRASVVDELSCRIKNNMLDSEIEF